MLVLAMQVWVHDLTFLRSLAAGIGISAVLRARQSHHETMTEKGRGGNLAFEIDGLLRDRGGWRYFRLLPCINIAQCKSLQATFLSVGRRTSEVPDGSPGAEYRVPGAAFCATIQKVVRAAGRT